MVWAGISHVGKTNLIIVNRNLNPQRYRDEILAPVVIPYIQANHNAISQQDNALPHTAGLTTQYLQENNINVMDWPSKSPDLSPIEQIWDLLQLDRRVRQRPAQPRILRQLEQALCNEWQNIPVNMIRWYLRSMNQRCRAVINAAGGHTRYSWTEFHFWNTPQWHVCNDFVVTCLGRAQWAMPLISRWHGYNFSKIS